MNAKDGALKQKHQQSDKFTWYPTSLRTLYSLLLSVQSDKHSCSNGFLGATNREQKCVQSSRKTYDYLAEWPKR